MSASNPGTRQRTGNMKNPATADPSADGCWNLTNSRSRQRQEADRIPVGTVEALSYEPNTARVIRLPVTQAGRGLLREAAKMIGGWGKFGGAALEEFDWDASAAEDKRLLDGHRGGH